MVVILGPTAVGKTEVSLQLAARLGGEIISADSRLFYKGMDIGTAKPTPAEQRSVPHHLIDVTTLDHPWSLAIFQPEVRRIIADIHLRGRLPLLVGGSGQYVQAVTEEWSIPRSEPDPALRAVLERWAEEIGKDALHQRLAVLDSQAASQIDPRNLRRTVRALEVILKTGRLFSSQRQKHTSRYDVIKIGLMRPRPHLYARIDQRIDAMISSGLVEEIRSLMAIYPVDLPPFSAIGYREIIDHLMGHITLEEATALIKRNTRIYVRRQANWFKPDDPDIHWFEMSDGVIDQIEQVLRELL